MGRHALVTGSTSGIGLSIAEALAAAGCDVAINGFGDADAIRKLEADLAQRHGVKVVYVGADLSKPDECKQMVAQANARLEQMPTP